MSDARISGNNQASYDFWNNPVIARRYAEGGNDAQISRFFQAREWLAENPFGERELLVDIGAGTGEVTQLFSVCNAAGRVLAVDYSNAMVSIAQRKIRQRRISNIQIWTSDAMDLKLPTKEETVHRIISFTAIHWFPDLSRFISGVERYLRQEGSFFFRYAGCEGDETLELAETMRGEEKWALKFEQFTNPMYTHTTEAMRGEIRKVGMVCQKAAIWGNQETFSSRDAYAKYVEGWLPHLYHLESEGDRIEFLNELVERHCSRDERCGENGEVTVMDTQIEIWGHKPAAPPQKRAKIAQN